MIQNRNGLSCGSCNTIYTSISYQSYSLIGHVLQLPTVFFCCCSIYTKVPFATVLLCYIPIYCLRKITRALCLLCVYTIFFFYIKADEMTIRIREKYEKFCLFCRDAQIFAVNSCGGAYVSYHYKIQRYTRFRYERMDPLKVSSLVKM